MLNFSKEEEEQLVPQIYKYFIFLNTPTFTHEYHCLNMNAWAQRNVNVEEG